jgi:hypothetical protein
MIDVHAHALHPDFLNDRNVQQTLGIENRGTGFGFAGYGDLDPLLFDIAARTESLRARGIELQLISPPPRAVSRYLGGRRRVRPPPQPTNRRRRARRKPHGWPRYPAAD